MILNPSGPETDEPAQEELYYLLCFGDQVYMMHTYHVYGSPYGHGSSFRYIFNRCYTTMDLKSEPCWNMTVMEIARDQIMAATLKRASPSTQQIECKQPSQVLWAIHREPSFPRWWSTYLGPATVYRPFRSGANIYVFQSAGEQGCASIEVLEHRQLVVEHSKFWWVLCNYQFRYCHQVELCIKVCWLLTAHKCLLADRQQWADLQDQGVVYPHSIQFTDLYINPK